MQFEELSLEEKVEVTLIYFKYKDRITNKGKKDADDFNYKNAYKIKSRLKGEKKVSIKC